MNDGDTTQTPETLDPQQTAFIADWILGGEEPELEQSDNFRDRGYLGSELDLGPVPAKLKAKLDAPGSGMISARDWGMIENDQRTAQLEFAKDYQSNIDTAKGKPNKMEKIQAVLPVLDAPGNNPERADIGAMLKDLEQIDKRYAELTSGPLTPEAKTELAKDQAHERAAKLNEMERKLAEWLNRRTELGLPPTREAMAMSDLVQREHTAVIKEFVDNGWSPPPVADSENMTEEEAAALKKTWDDMVNGDGCIKVDVDPAKGNAYDHMLYQYMVGENHAPTQPEKDRFRIELLSNMSRLCGSPAGRGLLASLEKAGKNITFFPFGDPAATADRTVTQAGAGADLDNPEAARAVGQSSIIQFPLGRKDSDEVLRTEDGNFLFSPTHVIIGHEMVHALHSAQGIHRGKVGRDMTVPEPPPGQSRTWSADGVQKWAELGLDRNMWTDFEEVYTINAVEMSEQTLRDDYGLSAVRFGHAFPETKDELATKAIEQAEKAKKFHDLMHTADEDDDTPDPRTMIVETRKFGQAFYDRLTDAQRFDVYDAMTKDDKFTGPLPEGWDPLRLTPAKIKAIAADKLPCRMPMLGWTSYKLEYEKSGQSVFGFPMSIKEIVTHRVHNPRTAQGRRFRELGEKATIDKFAAFKTATGTDLGRWDDRDWRVNLQTLNRAAATLDTMIETLSFLTDPDSTKPTPPDKGDPMETRLKRIADRFAAVFAGNEPEKAGPYFADDALTYFAEKNAGDEEDVIGADIGNLFASPEEKLAELKEEEKKLVASDKRLKDKGGLDVGAMSVVARAKAKDALEAFEQDSLVAEARTLAEALGKLIGKDDKRTEAAETYARLLGKLDLLTAKLSSIAPAELANAIRKIVMDPLDAELLARDDLGDILDDAMQAAEAEGRKLAGENPDITRILANSHLCDALGDYIEETHEGGKALWSFRMALHLRETRSIADLAQGNGLVKAGLRQDTVVKLRRDATDPDARATATSELRMILTGRVAPFLEWYARKNAVG